MQFDWPRIRLKKPAKHGWRFSVFAGLCATAWVWALGVSPPSTTSPTEKIAAIVTLLTVFSMGLAAARAAGWIARAFGAEDHGWIAGAVTAPLFAALVECLLSAQGTLYDSPLSGSVLLCLGIAVFVLPFCILGTMAFAKGLDLWSDIVAGPQDPWDNSRPHERNEAPDR